MKFKNVTKNCYLNLKVFIQMIEMDDLSKIKVENFISKSMDDWNSEPVVYLNDKNEFDSETTHLVAKNETLDLKLDFKGLGT
eukprot:gene6964-11126_t